MAFQIGQYVRVVRGSILTNARFGRALILDEVSKGLYFKGGYTAHAFEFDLEPAHGLDVVLGLIK